MKNQINAVLKSTLDNCFKGDFLKKTPIPNYVIEVPNNPDHGHFATNLPLTLAPGQKRNPMEIASVMVENLADDENLFEKVEVAAPGFINFRINPEKWYDVLSDIIRLRKDYGKSPAGNNMKVLVEFVSANPTGPLHLGHGRGAALGDTLCRILSFCGYDVAREFYINDAGQQIRILGESIFSRFKQINEPDYPFPENGYHGEYVLDLAGTISEKLHLNDMSEQEAIDSCAAEGKEIMLEEIKRDLDMFRVSFDFWHNESDLFGSGLLEDTLDKLEKKKQLYENDGALWIRTSDFGDDKDRVIRKKDGQFTYFASDISYHLEKEKRGFTKAINIWGADHHGYIPRVKAALSAHGLSEEWLSVLLVQLVKLWEGGQEI
ncbi:arginine--tRNA ligase, partial [Methanosarcinales archaeon]